VRFSSCAKQGKDNETQTPSANKTKSDLIFQVRLVRSNAVQDAARRWSCSNESDRPVNTLDKFGVGGLLTAGSMPMEARKALADIGSGVTFDLEIGPTSDSVP